MEKEKNTNTENKNGGKKKQERRLMKSGAVEARPKRAAEKNKPESISSNGKGQS